MSQLGFPASQEPIVEQRGQISRRWNRFLGQLFTKVQRIEGTPWGAQNGRLIEGLSLQAGETKDVAHQLGRGYVGAMPVNVRARPCSFRAYLSANQSGIAGNALTLVEFDTVSHDRGLVFDLSAHRFTAPLAGTYRFDSLLQVNSTIG
ncbi:MAG: hypothetical protein AAF654_11000, partial [Myxococcota bacterium]